MKISKKLLLLTCLFIFSLNGYSQDMLNEEDNSKPMKNKQIGINSTALISQLINFSSDFSFFNDEYMLTYKKQVGKYNFRFGVGANLNYQKTDFGGSNSGSTTNGGLNIRIGGERFTDISKRWRVYYGADFKTGLTYSKQSFFDDPARMLYVGGGPVSGLQFNISSRLSISTEASYNLIAFSSKNDNGSSQGISTSFSIPDFFYLNFDF